MRKHTNWQEYAADVAPRLSTHLQQQRLPTVERWLQNSFWLFSFVHEKLEEDITKNKDAARKLYPLLVELQDLLRGLIHAQEATLLAATTLQARVAFEIRCTIAFITQHADPAKYADRFTRYAEIERWKYQSSSPTAPRLTEEEKAVIRRKCPEWFKADGTLKTRLSWTAEPETDNLKKIAEAVGLLEDYQRSYAIASKITHGSPLARNLYSSVQGIGLTSLASPQMCADLAMTGSGDALQALIKFCVFAGVPMPQADILGHLTEGTELSHSRGSSARG